jgi:hypothetical protein
MDAGPGTPSLWGGAASLADPTEPEPQGIHQPSRSGNRAGQPSSRVWNDPANSARAETSLPVHAAQMMFDGLRAEEQGRGNLLIGHAFGSMQGYSCLLGGERLSRLRSAGARLGSSGGEFVGAR